MPKLGQQSIVSQVFLLEGLSKIIARILKNRKHNNTSVHTKEVGQWRIIRILYYYVWASCWSECDERHQDATEKKKQAKTIIVNIFLYFHVNNKTARMWQSRRESDPFFIAVLERRDRMSNIFYILLWEQKRQPYRKIAKYSLLKPCLLCNLWHTICGTKQISCISLSWSEDFSFSFVSQWKPAMAHISSEILGLRNWFFIYYIIKKLRVVWIVQSGKAAFIREVLCSNLGANHIPSVCCHW